MNVDKIPAIALLIFGCVAGLMTLIFFVGFNSITKPMIQSGAGDIGNYTANTTAWSGLQSSFNAAPLLVFLLFGMFVIYAGWKLLSSHVNIFRRE